MSIQEAEPVISPERLLITAAELAELLHVSIRTLRRLASGRRLPEPVRFGGTVRWRLEEVKTWIAAGCPAIPERENGLRRK